MKYVNGEGVIGQEPPEFGRAPNRCLKTASMPKITVTQKNDSQKAYASDCQWGPPRMEKSPLTAPPKNITAPHNGTPTAKAAINSRLPEA